MDSQDNPHFVPYRSSDTDSETQNYERRPNLRLMNSLYWLNSRSITLEMQKHPLYEKLLPLLGMFYFPKKMNRGRSSEPNYELSIDMLEKDRCHDKLINHFKNYFNQIHDLLGTQTENTYRRSYLKIQDLFSLLGISNFDVTMSLPGTNHFLFNLGLDMNESRFLINGRIVHDFYQSSLKISPLASHPFSIRDLPLSSIGAHMIKTGFDKNYVAQLDEWAMLSAPTLKDKSRGRGRCRLYGFIDEMLIKNGAILTYDNQ